MRYYVHIAAAAAALALMGSASCGHKSGDAGALPDDILVSVGDSSLTMTDVLRRIPSGIAPEDSAEMFRLIADRWVERMVLREVAEKNIPDMARIDEMTERYRDNLIVSRYLSMMDERGARDISEERLREYYDAHSDMMKLRQPLVKGVFVKVASGSDDLPRLRRWLASATPESIDNIEKYGLRNASQYEYFGDRWTAWNAVADLIPYRFYDADAFVSSTRDFETEYAGSVYLLKITDFLPSGGRTPFEFARDEILGILRSGDMVRGREDLIRSIYSEALDNGQLRPGLYDPLKHDMKGPEAPNANKNKKLQK